MNTWICYSPSNCVREDDAIKVHDDGTLEVAIIMPEVTLELLKHGKHVQKDFFYPVYSDIMCSFGKRCTRENCTFQHAHRRNIPRIFSQRITNVEKGSRAGFELGKKVRAIVMKQTPKSVDYFISDVQIDTIWTAEYLPPGIEEFAVLKHKDYPHYCARAISYTWDALGNTSTVRRETGLKRFFVEYCLDTFSMYASTFAGVVGSSVDSSHEGLQRYFDARNGHPMPVAMPNIIPHVCIFTHPLRDHGCMLNMISLCMHLSPREQDPDYPLLGVLLTHDMLYTSKNHERRIQVCEYVNAVESGARELAMELLKPLL